MRGSGDAYAGRAGWGATLLGFALISLAGCVHHRVPDTKADAREGLAYRLVASLTTDVRPRLTGTPAEAAARDWAVAKVTELGFKNAHIEPLTITGWGRG